MNILQINSICYYQHVNYFSVTKFAEVFYESKSAGAREKIV